MEQKDYLMREIEKIGLLLRSILGSLMNKKDNLPIETQTPFAQTNELLINEINFHLDKFLTLDKSATKEYISKFNGITSANLELLAEILFQFGISDQSDNKRIYFEKALQLYELSSIMDKTFSSPRENRIDEIKNVL
ncbi:MAG: hypothetical protein WCQ95_07870 [Bacteroidota bacterium]